MKKSFILIIILLFVSKSGAQNLIEVACGTGYWTNHISKTATSIYATDINESVVKIAKEQDRKSVV